LPYLPKKPEDHHREKVDNHRLPNYRQSIFTDLKQVELLFCFQQPKDDYNRDCFIADPKRELDYLDFSFSMSEGEVSEQAEKLLNNLGYYLVNEDNQ
jgi:hypothetical protein